MAFRDGPFENIKVPLAWTAAVAVVVAVIGAVALVASDGRDTASTYSGARAGADAAQGPVSGVLAAPGRWLGGIRDGIGGYFFAVSENRRLKAEIAELEQWRDDAIVLKGVNQRYETLLGLRPEPAVRLQTARTVADARGPFSRARLLDAGANKGIRIGNPVINEHGLIGRIVGVSGSNSRLVLLTDVASRTPIMVDRTDARFILAGDGSNNPRLEFVRGVGGIQAGDRILSSGDGGGFPRGIPIGVAAKGLDGSWRVKLFSDKGAIDFVRIMLFQNFGDLVDPNSLNAAPLAGLPPQPVPAPRPAMPARAPTATPTAAPRATAPRPLPVAPAAETPTQAPAPAGGTE
ncbi:MAG: rod shape-determining protein MreC [Brevundimonas sp.]|nr:MAG: rod shape-determining protein MreC [Brevundimonas sp.]